MKKIVIESFSETVRNRASYQAGDTNQVLVDSNAGQVNGIKRVSLPSVKMRMSVGRLCVEILRH